MQSNLASKIGFTTALLTALLAGCGDESSGSGGGGSGGATATGGTTASGGTTATGGEGGTTTTPTSNAAPEWVVKTDVAKGEFPEGLFVTKDTAFLGFAALGTVKKVALADGAVSDFGAIPPIPQNDGFLLGIALDAGGNAYVGFGGGAGATVKPGVYKIPAAGGSVSDPFATAPTMYFPNGLVFVGADLFVADSGGSIFKIAADGTTATWLSDASLSGANSTCANPGPFPIGANGIVKIGDAFFVSNSSLSQIVKIPIEADGSAGTPSVFLQDCDLLGGIDGIAVDPDGKSILAALNAQSKIARIDASAKVTDLFSGAPLDNPASVSIASGSTTLYITNSSFSSAAPTPGLLSFEVP